MSTQNNYGPLSAKEELYKKHIGKLVRVTAYRKRGPPIRHVGLLEKVFLGNLWVKKPKQYGKIHIDSVIKFEILPDYYFEVTKTRKYKQEYIDKVLHQKEQLMDEFDRKYNLLRTAILQKILDAGLEFDIECYQRVFECLRLEYVKNKGHLNRYQYLMDAFVETYSSVFKEEPYATFSSVEVEG